MKRGVLYYNRGTACVPRLLASIHSLRTTAGYAGEICVLNDGPPPDWLATVLDREDVSCLTLEESTEHVLVRKSTLWRHTPFDTTLFLDSDTIVQRPIDELFPLIEERGLMVTWFSGWSTHRPLMRRRILDWEKVAPELIGPAIQYGHAINTGVYGWTRSSPHGPAHEDLTRRGHAAGCQTILLDELAMQLLLPQFPHHLAHHTWNTSGSFGDIQQAKIIHYHGKKHCVPLRPQCEPWKRAYFAMRHKHWQTARPLLFPGDDRRLKQFYKTLGPRKDLTMVIAVPAGQYAEALAACHAWAQVPGLREQTFLFISPDDAAARLVKNGKLPRSRAVKWKGYGARPDARRYTAECYTFYAADRIRTPYWARLAFTFRPGKGWWEWPDYTAHRITSHRSFLTGLCGVRPGSPHPLNRLDAKLSPDRPLVPRLFGPGELRVVHGPGTKDGLPARFDATCHIESVEHTRQVATLLRERNRGRLIIPDAETTSWYCSWLWNSPVKLMNMHDWAGITPVKPVIPARRRKKSPAHGDSSKGT